MGKQEVAFLKKSSAKDFYKFYKGSGNVPRGAEKFCGAFSKATAYLTFFPPHITKS
jgi:hypothetical protein